MNELVSNEKAPVHPSDVRSDGATLVASSSRPASALAAALPPASMLPNLSSLPKAPQESLDATVIVHDEAGPYTPAIEIERPPAKPPESAAPASSRLIDTFVMPTSSQTVAPSSPTTASAPPSEARVDLADPAEPAPSVSFLAAMQSALIEPVGQPNSGAAVQEPPAPAAAGAMTLHGAPLGGSDSAWQETPRVSPVDSATERLVARVRRLMLISSLTTVAAIAAVVTVIGYRLVKNDGLIAPRTTAPETSSGDMTLSLPRGSRIIQTAVAENRLVVTLMAGGVTEIRLFDLKTLKPVGRLTFLGAP